jgi:RHS repeat-associated protein
VARFVYDGRGRRAQKIVGGVTRTYVYDGADIIEERTNAGATVRYVHGPGIDQPLANVESGTTSYYLTDHLGSIVQMTSASATVTLTRQYDVSGNLIQGATSGGYAFTGREWDPEIGLYYYRARYYHPLIGRFISEDPAGLDDGPNRYLYVRNGPVGRIDPTGRLTDDEEKYCRSPKNWGACKDGAVCALVAHVAFGSQDSNASNAQKHCVWACCLARRQNAKVAFDLTDAHEAGPGDRCEKQMDLANNATGIALGLANPSDSCFTVCDPTRLQCQPKKPPCF